MKDLQLSIYDTLGYVIPSFILIFGTIEILNLYSFFGSRVSLLISFSATQWVILIIISYFLGHCLHAISNLTLDRFLGYPAKGYFEKRFKDSFDEHAISELVKKVSEITGGKDIKDKTSFLKSSYWICYAYVVNNSNNALSPIFLSLTGFYRGLSVSFALLSILSLVRIIFFSEIAKILYLAISIAFLVLFIFRAMRFSNYLSNSVYTEFLVLSKKG